MIKKELGYLVLIYRPLEWYIDLKSEGGIKSTKMREVGYTVAEVRAVNYSAMQL